MRPEKPTQFSALISNCGSVDITDHVDSSISKVNVPAALTRLDIVNETGEGGGLKSAISKVRP